MLVAGHNVGLSLRRHVSPGVTVIVHSAPLTEVVGDVLCCQSLVKRVIDLQPILRSAQHVAIVPQNVCFSQTLVEDAELIDAAAKSCLIVASDTVANDESVFVTIYIFVINIRLHRYLPVSFDAIAVLNGIAV